MKVFTCAAKLAAAARVPAARRSFKIKGQSAKLAQSLENKSPVCVRLVLSRVLESSGFPGLPGRDGTCYRSAVSSEGHGQGWTCREHLPRDAAVLLLHVYVSFPELAAILNSSMKKCANGSCVQERVLSLATLATATPDSHFPL